jgi:hypothetical protein
MMQTSTQLKWRTIRRDQKCVTGSDIILFGVQYQEYLAQGTLSQARQLQ